MKTWKMAYRNIWRNKRRTLITVSAATFALLLMIVYAGLLEGMKVGMERNATALQMADMQVHATGYRDEPSIYTIIEDPDAVTAPLEAHGFATSGRVLAFGLVSSGPSSAGTMVIGLDPAREGRVTEINDHLQEGRWLSADDPHGVVIGNKMAVSLGAKIGTELVYVSQGADGSIANDLYKVRGVLKTVGSATDRSTVFMNIGALRDVMVIPDGVHEIAIRRPEGVPLAAATDRALAYLVGAAPPATDGDTPADPAAVERDRETLTARGLELLNWKQLNPALAEMFGAWDSFMVVFYAIFDLAVMLIILNTMLMSVFERVREFGVLKAVGMPPLAVIRMVVAEAIVQVGLATAIGTIVGVSLSLFMQTHGIDLTRIAGGAAISGIAIDPHWRTLTTAKSVVEPVATLLVVGMAGVIYPAIKAGFIQPLKAIHHR